MEEEIFIKPRVGDPAWVAQFELLDALALFSILPIHSLTPKVNLNPGANGLPKAAAYYIIFTSKYIGFMEVTSLKIIKKEGTVVRITFVSCFLVHTYYRENK